MKIKALVTMLVLGASSVALADTYGPTVRDHRSPYRPPIAQPLPAPPVVQAPHAQAPVAKFGGRFGMGFWRKPAQQLRPVLLANDTRVTGWSNISVASTNRMFTKLELKANSGRTDIDRVMITFGNGQRQVVSLRGRGDGLLNGNKSLTIDLEGGARNIKSVLLIGSSGRRASIDVLAV
ncbi:MAG TPA: hypothetical protein VIV11_12610 [Kofleriaceae bacterium]